MADETTPAAAPATLNDMVQLMAAATGMQSERLMTMFTEAMRAQTDALVAAQGQKKIGIGEYDPKTFVQPVKALAHKLTRQCWQNGFLMDPDQLDNVTIDALNQITRSGRYLDRLVEVIVREDGADETVELRYANRSSDQRNAIKGVAKSIGDMLTQIVAAQQAEDALLIAAGETRSRRALFGGPADAAGLRAARARKEADAAAAAVTPA
jgi:hypothetical protein